jgi:uncharacterized SAM-binding protein YcdF (DUF218 family)
VRDLLDLIFSVGGILLVFLAAALWVARRPASRRARLALVAVAVLYTALSTYVVGHAAGRLLSISRQPFEAADVPAGRTAIVILGSGTVTVRDWGDRQMSVPDFAGAARVLEAARVFRLIDPEYLVSSGGRARPDDRVEAPAIAMRNALLDLEVPPSRVLVQTTSRNTREEAIAVAAMLRLRQIEHVVLVTSADHMRRTLGAFRAVGVNGIPAVAREPFEPKRWSEWIIPGNTGFWKSGAVAHETLGILYYRVRGWYK